MKTKEEILAQNVEILVNCKVTYNMTNQGILNAMQEYSDQQTKDLEKQLATKDKEIEILTKRLG